MSFLGDTLRARPALEYPPLSSSISGSLGGRRGDSYSSTLPSMSRGRSNSLLPVRAASETANALQIAPSLNFSSMPSLNSVGLRKLHELYQSRLESIYSRFAQTTASIAQDVTIQVLGRDAQSANFVVDRITEIVKASIYDEKELLISQLSMQLASNSSRLDVAEGDRSFLRANLDQQLASTTAALRQGIQTSQQQAWAQRQVDVKQNEALRAEAVTYAEKSDTYLRELTQARQEIKEMRDAAELEQGALQQQLRRANQTEEREHAALQRQEAYYLDIQQNAQAENNGLRAELDRTTQQRLGLAEQVADLQRKYTKAESEMHRATLDHERALAKVRQSADTAENRLRLEYQDELHKESQARSEDQTAARHEHATLQHELAEERARLDAAVQDAKAARQHQDGERTARMKLESRLRDAMRNTSELRQMFTSAQADAAQELRAQRTAIADAVDSNHALRDELNAAQTLRDATVAKEQILYSELEAARAETHEAKAAVVAATDSHQNTVAVHARQIQDERAKFVAQAEARQARMSRAYLAYSDKILDAQDDVRRLRRTTKQALTDEWTVMQDLVVKAFRSRQATTTREIAVQRQQIASLELEVQNECRAAMSAHEELGDVQAKWAAELEKTVALATEQTQQALDAKEKQSAADIEIVEARLKAEELKVQATLEQHEVVNASVIADLQTRHASELAHVRDELQSREANALLEESKAASTALRNAEEQWKAMTQSAISKVKAEMLELDSSKQILVRRLQTEVEMNGDELKACKARHERHIENLADESNALADRLRKKLALAHEEVQEARAELVEQKKHVQVETESLQNAHAVAEQHSAGVISDLEIQSQARLQELEELRERHQVINNQAQQKFAAERQQLLAKSNMLSDEIRTLEEQCSASQSRLRKESEQVTQTRASCERELKLAANRWEQKVKDHEESVAHLSEQLKTVKDESRETRDLLDHTKVICARETHLNKELEVAYEQQSKASNEKLEEAGTIMKNSMMKSLTKVTSQLRADFDRERQELVDEHSTAMEKLRQTVSTRANENMKTLQRHKDDAVAKSAALAAQLETCEHRHREETERLMTEMADAQRRFNDMEVAVEQRAAISSQETSPALTQARAELAQARQAAEVTLHDNAKLVKVTEELLAERTVQNDRVERLSEELREARTQTQTSQRSGEAIAVARANQDAHASSERARVLENELKTAQSAAELSRESAVAQISAKASADKQIANNEIYLLREELSAASAVAQSELAEVVGDIREEAHNRVKQLHDTNRNLEAQLQSEEQRARQELESAIKEANLRTEERMTGLLIEARKQVKSGVCCCVWSGYECNITVNRLL